MYRQGLILAVLALTVGLAFQNCGAPRASQGQSTSSDHGDMIVSKSTFQQVVFDPQLELQQKSIAPASGRIEIDLGSGNVNLTGAGGVVRSCVLDATRKSQLEQILTDAEVCEPAPLADGMATCMALGIADIELVNASEKIQLRPVVCNFGRYLCAGKDAELRALLSNLREAPPTDCR